jgi:subtilisin-like proprotein convertase family protein
MCAAAAGALAGGSLAALAAGCDAGQRCGSDTVEVDGACVARTGECPRGTVEEDGECVPDGSVVCGTGTMFNPATGTCDPDITGCAEGTVLVEGECVPEEDVREGDVEESPEPNDGPPEGFAAFDLPGVGDDILIEGCIEPYRDADGDGERDPDVDAFVFEADAPTLLDVTVDGVGGAAGGFTMVAAADRLTGDGWVRFGINLTGDTTQQQVFLPAAGSYALLVADSRSVLTDLAAGGPGACYFATVARIAIPAPTALDGAVVAPLGGAARFYAHEPEAGGEVIRSAVAYASSSAAAGLVQMVNGEYRGSTPFVDVGAEAAVNLASLSPGDEVVLVVEPITNFSLSPVETTLTVDRVPTAEIATDGTPVTLVHEDASPDLVFFQATAGDVIRLQFDPGAVPYDITLYPPATTDFDFFGDQWISVVCSDFECAGGLDSWVQLQETGFYYLTIANQAAADGEPYQVGFTITPDTPATLVPGAAATGSLAAGRDFFQASFADQPWLEFAVEAAGLAGARLRFYRRGAAGEIDELVLPVDEGISAGGAPFGRIVEGSEGSFLVSVEDAAGGGPGGAFELSVAEKEFVDAGAVAAGAPVSVPDIALGAQPVLALVRGPSGGAVRVSAIGDGADLVIEQLDRTEASLFARDAGGAGQEESLARLLGDEGFIAVRISAAGGGAGSFDLAAAVVDLAPAAAARAPALPIPDGDEGGVSDSLTITEPCAVSAVTVDVDITHPFRGDIRLRLTGPSGTAVVLKQSSGDADENVVGTFPTTLVPVGNLDSLVAEDGAGTWTLTAADVFADDEGTLNAWGVNLLCM